MKALLAAMFFIGMNAQAEVISRSESTPAPAQAGVAAAPVPTPAPAPVASESYLTLADRFSTQVKGLSILGILGSSAGHAVHAAGSTPGIAWRVARFSCDDDKKLEKEILCPALKHLQGMNSLAGKVASNSQLGQPEARAIVDMSLFLFETQQKVIGKCITNKRINSCLNSAAMSAVWNSLTSRSTTSLQNYATNMISGDGLIKSIECAFPSAANFATTGQMPAACPK